MTGIFTPLQLAIATNQDISPTLPESQLFNIYSTLLLATLFKIAITLSLPVPLALFFS